MRSNRRLTQKKTQLSLRLVAVHAEWPVASMARSIKTIYELLARVKAAIPVTKFDGEKSSKNAPYVDAVVRINVTLGVGKIRRRSSMLEDLEKKGAVMSDSVLIENASEPGPRFSGHFSARGISDQT